MNVVTSAQRGGDVPMLSSGTLMLATRIARTRVDESLHVVLPQHKHDIPELSDAATCCRLHLLTELTSLRLHRFTNLPTRRYSCANCATTQFSAPALARGGLVPNQLRHTGPNPYSTSALSGPLYLARSYSLGTRIVLTELEIVVTSCVREIGYHWMNCSRSCQSRAVSASDHSNLPVPSSVFYP
jgi:hypothetical protein